MISIVVPIYNSEAYLNRCLDSILCQSYSDWECILVDDNSTDKSASIASRYADKDCRFSVIRKANSGANLSRKEGFLNAHGKYIIFIDSDDYLEPQMLDELYTSICKYNTDMAICGWYTDNHNIKVRHDLPLNNTIITQEKIYNDYIMRLLYPPEGSIPAFLWIRLIKTDSISSNMFVSDREYLPEDFLLLLMHSFSLHSISVVNKPLYHYCVNSSSLTTSFVKCGFDRRLACYELMKQICTNNNISREVINSRLDNFLLCAIRYGVLNACRIDSFKTANREINNIYKNELVSQLFSGFRMKGQIIQTKIIYYSFKLKCNLPQYLFFRWRMSKQ